jgi:GT2 family glycosyltransferase
MEYGIQEIVLTIIIKTLNEAKNIEAVILSIQKAAVNVKYEIIVADSLSSDETVEVACIYPVRVVQLVNPDHRSCGVGAQLGYQVSRGRYIYLLDGDMVCEPGFIDEALNYLDTHPGVAGVAGDMVELGHGSYEFNNRRRLFEQFAQGEWHGEKPWLDGGGIYRRSALQDVGYITNRNLHAYEEKELGLRLGVAGWRLVRIPLLAVHHHGHQDPTMFMLLRRWNTKYVNGGGDFLRASIGTPYFMSAVQELAQFLVIGVVLILTFIAFLLAFWTKVPLLIMVFCVTVFFLMSLARKRGFEAAIFNMLYLSFWSVGVIRGLICPQINPASEIPYIVLK